ncbi:MAG: hypothetical protein EHM54_02000 [Nitrospiraceae bacterium]|jgi:hypothetical protein|nr:MAG: hypothetical protein EHM54_02000 [Nitrospiraceae bacterium]
MNKKEVLDITAEMMKKIVSYDEVDAVTQRSIMRGKEAGTKLMLEEKERVNKLIKDILSSLDYREVTDKITEDTYDAFVFRYFSNVKYLADLETDDIELPDMVPENAFSVWASVMLIDVDCL